MNMTFLKKIGSVIGKGLVLLGKYEGVLRDIPGAGPVVTEVQSDLSAVAKVIVDIEVAGQALEPELTGAQKLIAATPGVAQVVIDSAVVGKRKIANPELFKRGSAKITDGMADVLNSLEADA